MKRVFFVLFIFVQFVSCVNDNSKNKNISNGTKIDASLKDDLFGRKFNCLNETKIFNSYSINSLSSVRKINDRNYAIAALEKHNTITLLFLEIFNDSQYKKNGVVKVELTGIKEIDPLFLLDVFEVLDTLSIGKLNNKEMLLFWNCRKNEIVDYAVFGLFTLEDKRYFTNPRKAWRIDVNTLKINVINVAGVDYYNGEYDVLPYPEN
jgi:hypothetical protein